MHCRFCGATPEDGTCIGGWDGRHVFDTTNSIGYCPCCGRNSISCECHEGEECN